MLMIFIYFMLFFSTSTLAFNFAFFLMPHAYKCPTVLKHEVIINNVTSATALGYGQSEVSEYAMRRLQSSSVDELGITEEASEEPD